MNLKSTVSEQGRYVTQIIHFSGSPGNKRTFEYIDTETIKDGTFTKMMTKDGRMIMVNGANVDCIEVFGIPTLDEFREAIEDNTMDGQGYIIERLKYLNSRQLGFIKNFIGNQEIPKNIAFQFMFNPEALEKVDLSGYKQGYDLGDKMISKKDKKKHNTKCVYGGDNCKICN